MDTLSDNALMLQVKEGNLDRMSLLFERHHRALYGFIFHMTGDREASEDLVQNVFLRMLNYRHSFAGTGKFRTWMFHLARNVLADHFKKNKRIKLVYTDEDIGDPLEVFAPGMDEEEYNELKILETAMMELSTDNLELLLLCRYQQLKYQEIAQLLRTSEGAVKVRVHRALGQLKAAYLKISKNVGYGMR